MSTFFMPTVEVIDGVPCIIYPMLGIEKCLSRGKSSLKGHLEKLYQSLEVGNAHYHIVILWLDETTLMTDVWTFEQLESNDTGYTVDCRTFRNLEEIRGNGITASDGLIILGREAELSESLRKSNRSILEYINAPRPIMPLELVSNDSF